MEEFVLSPPSAVLAFGGGVVLLAVLLVFLAKGNARRKVIGVVVTVVVVVVVVVIFYRPTTITVDSDGVTVGRGVELSWTEVESAVYEPDLANSPFRPTVRTAGYAVGDYRSGRFLLSNGDRARVHTEQSASAVILRTEGLTYVLGPEDAAGLAEAVDTYRVYVQRRSDG